MSTEEVDEKRLNAQNKNTRMRGSTFKDNSSTSASTSTTHHHCSLARVEAFEVFLNLEESAGHFLFMQFSKELGRAFQDELVLLRVLKQLKYFWNSPEFCWPMGNLRWTSQDRVLPQQNPHPDSHQDLPQACLAVQDLVSMRESEGVQLLPEVPEPSEEMQPNHNCSVQESILVKTSLCNLKSEGFGNAPCQSDPVDDAFRRRLKWLRALGWSRRTGRGRCI